MNIFWNKIVLKYTKLFLLIRHLKYTAALLQYSANSLQVHHNAEDLRQE